ncbi:MAG TPA: type II secretion system F family protein [Flavobacterium sp.]|jgi:type IV pilus assembly protein PilC
MGFKLDTPIAKTTGGESSGSIDKFLKTEIIIFGDSFSNRKKQLFYQELAVLLNSGITIKESLTLIYEAMKKQRDAEMVETILSSVINGKPFSQAVFDAKVFSEYDFYSLRIGEETGTMSRVCHELGIFYAQKNEQRRIVVAALTYPAIVLTTALFVLVFMLGYVVPMFQDIFRQNNMELPMLTKVIVSLSQLTKDYGWVFFASIVVIAVSGRLLKDKKRYQRAVDHLLLKMPIFGTFVKRVYLAQFTQAIALLTTSKVPMLNSVQMVKKMIRFAPLQEALEQVELSILNGHSLSSSLRSHKLFDSRIISLVKVAEETNQTEYVFKQLSDQYSQEVIQQSKVMTTVLEPLIILFVGGVVAVLLIAMYLPMFQLSSAIG